MQQRIQQLSGQQSNKKYYSTLNYHLKKTEPFQNRQKRTVAAQMKQYPKQEKASIIPLQTVPNAQKRLTTKTTNGFGVDAPDAMEPIEPDFINEEHVSDHFSRVSSRMGRFEADADLVRKNGTVRGVSDGKGKKIGVSHRGKSLKYWKVETSEPKIFTHIKGFFNTIMSDKDGCNCGSPCECTQILLKWLNVPEDLIKKNYERMLRQSNMVASVQVRTISVQSSTYRSSDIDLDLDDDLQTKQIEREKYLIQIRKDVIRTQTQCQLFHRKQTQQKLERILMCYTTEDPEVGYVQSMNIVVSGLLYHIRNQAQTYAVSRKLFHQIRSLYLQDFKECYAHIDKITTQLHLQVYDLYTHLLKLGVQLKVILFSWILSLLCVVVPLQHLHRVYIGFVGEGWNFVYKAVLAVFLYLKEDIKRIRESWDVEVFLSVSNQDMMGRVCWQEVFDFVGVLKLVH